MKSNGKYCKILFDCGNSQSRVIKVLESLVKDGTQSNLILIHRGEKAMTYQEAEQYILNIPRFSKKTGLDNIKECLKRLKNPQDNFYTIHIAGTNGKGSVCNYLDSVLREAGYYTGMFTSPHLVTMRERMKVDGEPISEEKFLEIFFRVKSVVDEMRQEGLLHPSFFEWVFLMAILFFSEKKIQVCILETGLGGRLDATNAVDSDASVITSLSYDHMQYLGDTLDKIAAEKAGIIKKRKPCFSIWQEEEARQVLENVAREKESPLHLLDKKLINGYKEERDGIVFFIGENKEEYHILTKAYYQIENAALAITVLENLFPKIPKEVIKKGLKKTLWEGRMDSVTPHIIIDGAHNEDAIEKFCITIQKFYSSDKKNLLFAVAEDKNYTKIIEYLCANCQFEKIMVTQIHGVRATSVEEIFNLFQQNTNTDIWVEEELEKAYEKMKNSLKKDELLFCVGSLYLVGSIKALEERKGRAND